MASKLKPLFIMILASISFGTLLLSFMILDTKVKVPYKNMTSYPQRTDPTPAKRVVFVVVNGLGNEPLFGYLNAPSSYLSYNFLDTVVKVYGTYGSIITDGTTTERDDVSTIFSGVRPTHSVLLFSDSPTGVDTIFNYTNTFYSGPIEIYKYLRPHSNNWWKDIVSYDTLDSDQADSDVFQNLHNLLAKAQISKGLNKKLRKEKTIFFLYVNGIATDYSKGSSYVKYDIKISKLSSELKKVFLEFGSFYKDTKTSFIMVGINAKDKEASETRLSTPFLAWGAGISKPCFKGDSHSATSSNIAVIKKRDMHQIDVAPLLSCLLSIPVPFHSMGVTPTEQLSVSDRQLTACQASRVTQTLNLLGQYESVSFGLSRFMSPFKKEEFDSLRSNLSHSEDNTDHNRIRILIGDLTCRCLQAIKFYDEFPKKFCVSLIIYMLLSWFLMICSIIISTNTVTWNPNRGDSLGARISLWVMRHIIEICATVLLLLVLIAFIAILPKTLPYILTFVPMFLLSSLLLWYSAIQYRSWAAYIAGLQRNDIKAIVKCTLMNGLLLVLFVALFGERSAMNVIFVITLMYLTFVEIRVEYGSRIGDWFITAVPVILIMIANVEPKEAFAMFLLPATFLWALVAFMFLVNGPLGTKDIAFIIFCVLSIFVALFHSGVQLITAEDDSRRDIMKYIMLSTSFLPLLILPFVASDNILIRIFQVALCLAVCMFTVSTKQEPLGFFFITLHLFCWLLIEAFGDSSVQEFKHFEVRNIPHRIRRYPGAQEARTGLCMVIYIFIAFFVIGFDSHPKQEGLQIIKKTETFSSTTTYFMSPAVKLFCLIFFTTMIHAYINRINGAPIAKSYLIALLFMLLSCIQSCVEFYISISSKEEQNKIYKFFIIYILTAGVTYLYPLSTGFSVLPSAGPPPDPNFQLNLAPSNERLPADE